jgi:hypothetical protein
MSKALKKEWNSKPNNNISRLKLFLASYENQKYEYSIVRTLDTKYRDQYQY